GAVKRLVFHGFPATARVGDWLDVLLQSSSRYSLGLPKFFHPFDTESIHVKSQILRKSLTVAAAISTLIGVAACSSPAAPAT
ncbi:MAG TPA: hypothetical protein VFT01_04460, partial [Homoserinimonas sp.]|nr:hypothetical protein [Homoserinimonas sp.]